MELIASGLLVLLIIDVVIWIYLDIDNKRNGFDLED